MDAQKVENYKIEENRSQVYHLICTVWIYLANIDNDQMIWNKVSKLINTDTYNI